MDRLGVYFGDRLVGDLAVNDGRFSFAYDASWLKAPDTFPVSQSLPLAGGFKSSNAAHAFFSNLLPEGHVRQLVARRLGVSEDNDFVLLERLGGECAGALVISREPPSPVEKHSYRPLDEGDLANLAKRGVAFAETSGTGGIRLSLAGAQDKLAVKVEGSRLLLPEGSSPSTHILKFANPDYKHMPENELIVTKLAARCGLPTVDAELRTIGRAKHLLVRRYDRVVDADESIRRLHQEDLCQALGVPPGRKYEDEGGPGFSACFGMIEEASLEPALDTRELIRWLTFNTIVGNADGHAKNLSLVRTDRDGLRLAPFYDLLSTAIYPRVATRVAMKIGKESDPGQVKATDWRELAKAIGVGSFVENTVRELAEVMPERARETIAELEKQYGRFAFAESVVKVIRERARRISQLLKG